MPPARPTAAEYARVAGELGAVMAALRARPVEHELVLSVPVKVCGGRKHPQCDASSLGTFRAHYQPPPGTNWWGPAGLWVDAQGAFWTADPLAHRAVGFGRDRRLAGEVTQTGESFVQPHAFAVADGHAYFIVSGLEASNGQASHVVRAPLGRDLPFPYVKVALPESITIVALPNAPLSPFFGLGLERALAVASLRSEPDAIALDPPAAVVIGGRRYALECAREYGAPPDGPARATLFVDGAPHALPACGRLLAVTQAGELLFRLGDTAFKLDATGRLAGAAIAPAGFLRETGSPIAAGHDGELYAMVPRKRTLDFMRLLLQRPEPGGTR